jgi:hypothetical protein
MSSEAMAAQRPRRYWKTPPRSVSARIAAAAAQRAADVPDASAKRAKSEASSAPRTPSMADLETSGAPNRKTFESPIARIAAA